MGITEGISVTIAQHNGGTPSFAQLWASDSESPKLDIYYREGISDLERRLEKWLQESSAQFDLQATGEDYTLMLNVSRSWPRRLEGLLKNKVQDYLVHTVTAGWLNDFEGISVKQDYQTMAAQDLDDIVYIVGLKSFDFIEKERVGETDKGEEADGSAQDRRTDEDKAEEAGTGAADERGSDSEKDDNEYTAEADERASDEDKGEDTIFSNAEERGTDDDKADGLYADNAEERNIDTEKAPSDYSGKADVRHSKNDTEIADKRNETEAGERNGDNDIVDIRHDFTDWSGTSPLWCEIDRKRAGRIISHDHVND